MIFVCSFVRMEEGSLKCGHVPTFDSPGKPQSKRRAEATCTPRARRAIGHSFTSSPIVKSRSPVQIVRLYIFGICIQYLFIEIAVFFKITNIVA